MLFSWNELKEITRGEWRGCSLPDSLKGVEAVTDDSRKVRPGDLFVAIPGGEKDGHNYLDQVHRAGAAAACVNKRRKAAAETDLPLLCVDNTLNAFHELARAHRRRFPKLDVLGITGSTGKTSVRCMLSAILEHAWPGEVLSTLGNTNNHFGVPRNLLRLQSHHRVAVLELGSNQPGEIAELTRLIRPRIGVLTNIGAAHLEKLGDTLGVTMEKSCLLTGLQGQSIAVIPDHTEHIEIIRQIVGSRPSLTFGTSNEADIQVLYQGCSQKQSKLTLKWNRQKITRQLTWNIGGRHQALNAAAAAAAATALKLSPDTIIQGLPDTSFLEHRMEVRKVNNVHWVNDAYNANPDSMRSGIEWFIELTSETKPELCFLILGDMLELGENTLTEHIKLLDWITANFPGINLLPVGPIMSQAARQLGIPGFSSRSAVKNELKQILKPGAWILLKGSRALELERLMPDKQL